MTDRATARVARRQGSLSHPGHRHGQPRTSSRCSARRAQHVVRALRARGRIACARRDGFRCSAPGWRRSRSRRRRRRAGQRAAGAEGLAARSRRGRGSRLWDLLGRDTDVVIRKTCGHGSGRRSGTISSRCPGRALPSRTGLRHILDAIARMETLDGCGRDFKD